MAVDKSVSEDGKGANPEEETSTGHEAAFTRRRRGTETRRSNIWIVSFTDIMALMLTFFVLLYSMSAPRPDTWDEMATSINRQFDRRLGATFNRGPRDTVDISRIDYNHALDLNYLQALISRHIEEEEVLRRATLKQVGGGLLVSFPQDIVFDAGSATMSEEGADAVYELALTLSRIRNRVEILGYDVPDAVKNEGGEYSSGWGFSFARAANVAAALHKVGYDRPVTVRGLSGAVYQNMPSETPEEEKSAAAGRVDILIRGDDGSRKTYRGLVLE